jgi:excinuclease ABC subunit C
MVPRRGDKRALVELATRNAELAYRTRFNEITAAHFDALETLRASIGLPAIPRRIECFDISTIQGSETVASMVVCEDGRMKKSEYRKYRIRGSGIGDRGSTTKGSGIGDQGSKASDSAPRSPRSPIPDPRSPGSDDFAAMREVVQRRYQKVIEDGGPFPDLVLIDGGKGQLTAAYDALESIGLGNLVAVGIAKKEEILFTRDRPDAIVLAQNDPALLLLQKIRDEAHRFAVTFHRKARSMRDLRSELDVVAGIGPRRRRALLTAFGSLAGVRRATREELSAIVGAKAASAVIDHFARS